MWTNEQIIKQLGQERTRELRHYAHVALAAEKTGRKCDAEMLWEKVCSIISEGVDELEAINDQN